MKMLRAVKWGFLSSLVVSLGVMLSAAIVALVGGQVADQLPVTAKVLWFVYLGLLLAVPSAIVLRLADQVEAFGVEGFERVSEDVVDMSLERGEGPRKKEEVLKDLLLFKGRLYRFAVKVWFFASALAGFYVGIGLLVSTWGWWLGLIVAVFPFLVATLAYRVFQMLRNSRKGSAEGILRQLRPLLGHVVGG
ncbi:hypothetical protein [Thermus tengchongensis]|uniref:Uncharacterized protein n=1 Tax=Thermus tengchongensis TaxID=1214928 RepID=A0A4Y9FCD1_9DEIN|nr:hypothetical protein [Thermus tengchongensis]TFU26153.1 hypothetical protein E0687_07105 [Thermus tengchongensis]